MLEVARRCAVERRRRSGSSCCSPSAEENGAGGREGVRRRAPAQSDFGYVFDHATPIGEIVVASPTYYRIEAEFRGSAAHAGIRPEDGRSAIVAAARAIAAMRLGRLDDETTANVGAIARRRGGTNVVAERCRVVAEARSLDDDAASRPSCAEMVDRVHDGAERRRVRRRRRRRAAVPTATASRRARPRSPRPRRRCAPAATSRGGSSPAAARTPTRSRPPASRASNLANGTERNHQPDERVASPRSRGCSTSRSRCSSEAAAPMLALRRGVVGRGEPRRADGSGSRSRSAASGARRSPTSALVGAVADRRRRRRQRRGARPRARLGRLRHRAREPDARPRGEGEPGAHVMKLNYTSLQHAVLPVEERATPARRRCRRRARSASSAARPARAAWPGRSAARARRPRRLRADRRRRAARRAVGRRARSCASAGCWPATSPPGRPYGGATARRSPPPARSTHGLAELRLGRRASSAPGPGSSARLGARPRRHGRRSTPRTPRWRSAARSCSCRACPRRPAPAPPRPLHHTRDGARPAARAVRRGAPAGDAARRGAGAPRRGAHGRERRPRRLRRLSGLPARTMGRGLDEDPRLLRRRARRRQRAGSMMAAMSSPSSSGSAARPSATGRHRLGPRRALPPRGRRGGRARVVAPPGRGRRSSRTTASSSGSCASRARPSAARPARAAGRQARRGGRAAARDRQARAAEEIGKPAEHWEHARLLLHLARVHRRAQSTLFLATGLSDVDERPRSSENERIEIEVCPLRDLDAIIAETQGREALIGLCCAARAAR